VVKPIFSNRVLILVDQSSGNQESMHAVADLVREAPPGMPAAFGVLTERAVFTHGSSLTLTSSAPALMT
jgi:hypothetical protein